MGAYKQLLAQDIIITPFEVNKGFTFSGAAQLTGSDVGIDRFIGKNIIGLFNPTTDLTTGQISTQYQRLVYNSIKELYYSNYLSGSYGSSASLATSASRAVTAVSASHYPVYITGSNIISSNYNRITKTR